MESKKTQCGACRGHGKCSVGPIEENGNNKLSYSEVRKMMKCKACGGRGYYIIKNPTEWERCNYCGGNGWADGNYCSVCGGLGKVKLNVL